MEIIVITHFEAPKSRQRGLRPCQTKLLFQSHPTNSFCETENPLTVSKGIQLISF